MRPRRRVIICSIHYIPEVVGVGRYSGDLAEYFVARGHDVAVITAPPHYPSWKVNPPYSGRRWMKEMVGGVIAYRCPIWVHSEMRGFRRLLAPASFALSAGPVAFWQILTRRPHVVLVVEPTLLIAPFAILAAKLVRARAILHVQDLEVDAAFAVGHLGGGGLLERCGAFFERVMTSAFDRVITISHRMAEKLRTKGVPDARLRVIRNWVDLDHIKPMPPSRRYRGELGLKDDDFVVLYAGTVGAKQGIRLLIDAARELQDKAGVVFVIAGEGPMRPELERAAAKMRNFRVIGFQPEARLGEFLSIADVHVLPQQRAAADLVLPSKLGGMLASGRRIIITADPGTELADFVQHCCALTPPGDGSALARAIVTYRCEPVCETKVAERLALAQTLSKDDIVLAFEQAALFSDVDPNGRATAELIPSR